MREVCMLSALSGRNTPCWWDCGTYCRRRLAGVKRGGGKFNAAELGNLAAWFQNNVGITSALGAVSQWDDQSGLGRHLIQATGTNQPALQADGSILFDGADNYLKCDTFTLDQPETIYLLFKQVTWTSADRVFDGHASASGALFQTGSSPSMSILAGSAVAPNADLAVGAYGVAAVVFNGASSLQQINNGTPTTGNAGAANMSGFTLGARGAGDASWSNIQVKEVIIYAAAHNAATRSVVINYLMNLGGL